MEQNIASRILEELRDSEIFKDYEQAYAEVTQLPLVLRGAGNEPIPKADKNHHEFCEFMREHNDSCKTCIHIDASQKESGETIQHACFAGLNVTAVPIKVHQEVIGYLQTGEVLLEAPTLEKLDAATKTLIDWGIKLDPDELKTKLSEGALLSPKQYEAVLKLLNIFAKHISEVAARLSVTPDIQEPDGIRKSREFINRHSNERISLDQVAAVANMSASHFCRVFKKATDMHFSEYVSRIRVDKAKSMLNEANYTMTHIAYDCGFNSVTDFNRTFKKITGLTPSGYRKEAVGQ